MCGVAGVLRFDGGAVDPGVVRAMTALLTHRGPDDEGYWFADGVGLGHRRLSIIDLNGSRQPMTSGDGRYALTFNGEILNYRQLRDRSDYPFQTKGDTEVVLATLAQRGPIGLRDLHGQFAFGVYDVVTRRLTLARDHVGILPLYYYVDDHVAAFASEIKALAPVVPGGLRLDECSLGDYLAHRAVPAPYTLFRGVRKLLPGHTLTISASGGSTLARYWSLPGVDEELAISPADAVDQVQDALEHAVGDALVADVPVGAYLSGGVDSSLIVALASKARGGEGIETFSAGFHDAEVDELPFARRVAELLGTTHHEIVLGPDEFEADWRRLSWHRDGPLSEPADVAVYGLARMARQHVKVVLSGEGSDELFAGYPKYKMASVGHQLGRLPRPVRAAAARGGEAFLPPSAVRPRIMLRALSASSENERLRSWFSPFSESERAALLRVPVRTSPVDALPLSGDPVRRLLQLDLAYWLPDNLLERGDRMSMAASLELRPPFLHPEVIELAFRLPSSVKVRRGRTKWVVKEVADRYLPAEIVHRPKVGFRVPLERWLQGSLGEMARDALLDRDSLARRVFAIDTVTALLDDHVSGRRRNEIQLWTLLSLELWHQQL